MSIRKAIIIRTARSALTLVYPDMTIARVEMVAATTTAVQIAN
jgi:hypothetical protein